MALRATKRDENGHERRYHFFRRGMEEVVAALALLRP